MADAKLPAKLKEVPIVDAVFEVRFKANVLISSLLPGLLFSKLEGKKEIQRLPVAELPEQMRAMDVNLLYAHHIRIAWERFTVNIGDRTLGVGCLGPYPGWTLFKKAIIEISNLVDETKLLSQVERLALKYTNIIPNSVGTAAAIANFDLRLGTKDASSGLFHIRAEIPDGDALHITQLASNGTVVLVDGSVREGTVIDIDTVRNNSPEVEPSIFFKRLPEQVEELHLKTKTMFFSLLKADTIAKLGATYG